MPHHTVSSDALSRDGLDDHLALLVAQSPPERRRHIALLRSVCAGVLSLPPLPSEAVVHQPEASAETVLADFAEQFSTDVSGVTAQHRAALTAALGEATFPAVIQCYIADFLPRVAAGLTALGLPVPWAAAPRWEPSVDAAAVLFTEVLPGVARLRTLDPVTTEIVRLRGAAAHHCRLCNSLRESTALEAGGSESLYDDIHSYESSVLLSDTHKAALRYTDALIWSPGHVDATVVAGVLEHFTPAQARELTLDVLRNASNKIAVAMAADAPRVTHGTEVYRIDAEGQPVYG